MESKPSGLDFIDRFGLYLRVSIDLFYRIIFYDELKTSFSARESLTVIHGYLLL